MSKKKKEHVTFDRMADNRPRLNQKAYIRNQEIKRGLMPRKQTPQTQPQASEQPK
ncbi:MAG: hypothetical protein ACM3ZQ_04080 [Bacillota bacterium]